MTRTIQRPHWEARASTHSTPRSLTGPQDLSQAIETRPDVRVYTAPVLEQDLRVNGALRVELFVSSNRTDTDFCVRLTDVYPDGRSLIATQGIRRMRFRNSLSTEEFMTPDQIYPVTVDLQDLALTFLSGHKLRVDVCSADYPHFDKNRNDGGPMYTVGPSFSALNAVYHDAIRPSRIVFQTPSNTPLSADFTWTPSFPEPGSVVTFTATASGGTPPFSYAWNLDGSAASGQTVTRAFAAGRYTVTCAILDGAGDNASSAKEILVTPAVLVTAVTVLKSPFRLRVEGVNFQTGCSVTVDGRASPQSQWKDSTLVVAKKGKTLKAMLPKGQVVQIVMANPDGTTSEPVSFTR